MNLTRDRARSIGWGLIVAAALALTLALTLRVNAVKSQVRLAERQIISLERQKMFLATEFETRANQQQLRALNDVEFGYVAPTAAQYLPGERSLAAFGKPASLTAPQPIRVATKVPVEEPSIFPAMVSPLTGKAIAAEMPRSGPRKPVDAKSLKDRLSQIRLQETVEE